MSQRQNIYYHTKTSLSTKTFLFSQGISSPTTPTRGMIPLDPQLQKHVHASAVSGAGAELLLGVLGVKPPRS